MSIEPHRLILLEHFPPRAGETAVAQELDSGSASDPAGERVDRQPAPIDKQQRILRPLFIEP